MKSSISVLESSLRTTEGSSGHWETFGWLCAVAVGIGIAGEIVVIVSEHFEDLEDWERGIIRPPDRPPAWRFWFDIVATLIVLGGVFGEAGATAAVASINSQLRSKTSELRAKSDQLLALVTQQAGTAGDNALLAQQSAKDAGIDAGKAKTKAEAVAKQAGELKTQLDAVEAKRAELETSLKNLVVCNAPRVIENISKGGSKITDPLKGFAESATIETVPNDAEAIRAASYLTGALQQAGWHATPGPPTGNIKDGVEVQSLGSSKAAEAVVDFLHSLYWQAKYEPWVNSIDRKTMPPTGLRIRVGLYPPVRYVLPPALKEFAANVPKWQQEMNNNKARMKENEEERLKHFAPQIRDQVRASHEQFMKEEAVETERIFGPCKPLEPLFPRP